MGKSPGTELLGFFALVILQYTSYTDSFGIISSIGLVARWDWTFGGKLVMSRGEYSWLTLEK